MDGLEGTGKRVGSSARKHKQKHLPRNDTEFHERKNKQKQKISHGRLNKKVQME